MKKIIDLIAYIGFYFIGGVLFLYQSWQLFWGLIFDGNKFNQKDPVNLDNMKWWLIIGTVSGIYLLYSGQLKWMTNWINKEKDK